MCVMHGGVPGSDDSVRAPARAGWSARRDHAAEDTRRALLGAAQRAFARDGYAATSLEAIVGAAGLTKGALYHHFGNKAGVLEALCLELQEALAALLAAAAAAASDDPWARAEIVVDAWCDAAAEPAYRQIVLRDAPGVLGASRLRDIDLRALLGVLTGVVGELVAAQQIRSVPIEATARVLLAAAAEIAAWLATTDGGQAARAEGAVVVRALLDGLRAPRERAHGAA